MNESKTRLLNLLPVAFLLLSVALSCGDDPPPNPECNPGDLGCLPSAERVCHTPCQRGLTAEDGTFRECAANGLMEGCIGDNTCVAGSCVLPGQRPRTCVNDRQCPDFQACIKGQCYSNCATDADCFSGTLCNKFVCRNPCTTDNALSCVGGAFCDSYDGQKGFCKVLPEVRSALPPGLVRQAQELDDGSGTLDVDNTSLKFSNIATEASFTITNNTDSLQLVVVQKTEHTFPAEAGIAPEPLRDPFREAGSEEEECDPALDCPLTWLRMGTSAEDAQAGSFIELTLESGESTEVFVVGADEANGPRWEGELVVGSGELNRTTIALTYTQRPEGLWTGEVHYYANFGVDGLETWRDNPGGAGVGNALLERWSAVRTSIIGWDEFLAVLTSVQTRSWDRPATREQCGESVGACYPFPKGDDEVQTFTSNLDEEPIPGGVVELPLALNLKLKSSDSKVLEGRINSSASLQYAGNPRFVLAAEAAFDAGDCSLDSHDHCLTFLSPSSATEDVMATIEVGGRYHKSGSNCETGFEEVTYPWLVPGFTRRVDEKERSECRNNTVPFADDPGLSVSLALGNPIPDGGTRQRTLHFIDGAMIDQRQLFIIFEERFGSFLDPEGDNAGFSAYGIMLLERTSATLEEDAFVGALPSEEIQAPVDDALRLGCSESLINELMVAENDLSESQSGDYSNLNSFIEKLITGVSAENEGSSICLGDKERVHYLCVDTGIIDGGPNNTTSHICEDEDLDEEALPERLGLPPIPNDDSCNESNNGVCEDTGPGAETYDGAFKMRDDSCTSEASLRRANELGAVGFRHDYTDEDTGEEMCGVIRFQCRFGTDVSDCGERSEEDYFNRDTCAYDEDEEPLINNGRCEDGGPGAEVDDDDGEDGGDLRVVSTCPFGTDFSDCGGRSILAALNTNDCEGYDNNQRCEDGGVGSFERGDDTPCTLGTDAADCPIRSPDDFDERVACPPESEVIFFAVNPDKVDQEDIADLDCQADGDCDLDDVSELDSVRLNPVWRCTDPDAVVCSANRFDLRDGKTFYEEDDGIIATTPLDSEINDAFRYKRRFRSRQGKSIGFTPQICLPGDSSQLPYCYNPEKIEAIKDRLDCLLSFWGDEVDDGEDYWDRVRRSNKNKILRALKKHFSFTSQSFIFIDKEKYDLAEPLVEEGFEHLNAELMVMLGDDALTRALSSRFDLAGANIAAFEGTAFEGDEGINLSGIAGAEMRNLHQAMQYYQEALDRFYRLAPLIYRSTKFGDQRDFVTPEMLTSYVQRVLNASTQKSRAGSEIALRYLSFNRPDLSRRVIERYYTGTYLESIVLSRIMLRLLDVSDSEDKAQIRQSTEASQLRYNQALFRMREVYSKITDDTTVFGLPPDLVPFPTLENVLESNGFEVIFERAKSKAEVASEREERALSDSRGFETDAAQFQSELASLNTTYENQLADLCGTFIAEDGRILPAIAKYADLDPKARLLPDPCGLMGAGQIHDAIGEIELVGLDIEKIKAQVRNVYSSIDIEVARVNEACNAIYQTADFVYEQQGKISDVQREINQTEAAFRRLEYAVEAAGTFAGLAKCEAPSPPATLGDCATGSVAAAGYGIAAAVFEVGAVAAEIAIVELEDDIADLERQQLRFEIEGDCDMARIDSDAEVANLLLQMKELELDAVRAGYEIQLGLSKVSQLRNQARRLELEQGESEQHLINIEAARNDPNVRIYKNDAVLNADFAFDDAMREAFRATRIFEYYTSQSFGPKQDLFLIRMASFGQPNLANYLTELENAFFEFEEFFGLPETRVMIISLRDDIIPSLNTQGQALSDEQRDGLMAAALRDPNRLDRKGYLTFPFSTNLKDVSPATRNHKIKLIEAEMLGSDLGDEVARLYVRQRGTSVVRPLRGTDCLGNCFYQFPQKLAVLNPFFSGVRDNFPFDLYQNAQFTDRPLINTSWELVLNLRDEAVNKDIDLSNLSDIKLYIYYSDFTDIN